MSRAESPAVPSSQAFAVPPENTTCSTGPSPASKGVSARAAPGAESPTPVQSSPAWALDRKSAASGQRVPVRVDLGGRSRLKQHTNQDNHQLPAADTAS